MCELSYKQNKYMSNNGSWYNCYEMGIIENYFSKISAPK